MKFSLGFIVLLFAMVASADASEESSSDILVLRLQQLLQSGSLNEIAKFADENKNTSVVDQKQAAEGAKKIILSFADGLCTILEKSKQTAVPEILVYGDNNSPIEKFTLELAMSVQQKLCAAFSAIKPHSVPTSTKNMQAFINWAQERLQNVLANAKKEIVSDELFQKFIKQIEQAAAIDGALFNPFVSPETYKQFARLFEALLQIFLDPENDAGKYLIASEISFWEKGLQYYTSKDTVKQIAPFIGEVLYTIKETLVRAGIIQSEMPDYEKLPF